MTHGAHTLASPTVYYLPLGDINYWLRPTENEAFYNLKEAGWKYAQGSAYQILKIDPDKNIVRILNPENYHDLDPRPFFQQVADYIRTDGSAAAYIPAKKDSRITKKPQLIADHMNRAKYFYFEVTAGMVIDAQKWRKQLGGESAGESRHDKPAQADFEREAV